MDSGPADPLRELEDELSRMFRRLRVITSDSVRRVSAGLDPIGVGMLRWIGDRGEARTGELVETFRMHKSTVSRILSDLAELGYLERVTDPADGRVHVLRLTDAGRTAVDEVRQDRSQHLAAALAALTADEIGDATRSLRRLNDLLG